MVRHIVFFTLKPDAEADKVLQVMTSVLLPLQGQIPGLQSIEVKQAYNGPDIVLNAELASREACAEYAQHPLHLAAFAEFRDWLAERKAADYEV